MAITCVFACIPVKSDPKFRPIVRVGFFYRSSDKSYVRRYRCRSCRRSFSAATRKPEYRQKKRQLNGELLLLFNSGISQRRLSLTHGLNRNTVVRKFRFLAHLAKKEHAAWQTIQSLAPISDVQFDDLETSEHTKCKPLSVALAVDAKSRKILSFQVSRMPAKGHLAEISRRKYGPRRDERPNGWGRLMKELKPLITKDACLLSDENPHYINPVKNHHPEVDHQTVKSRRGCIAGQGELKKIGFDPLFSLNHTCAMLRANLNRLFRRTWCTTKTIRGLEDHLALYVVFHNQVLTER